MKISGYVANPTGETKTVGVHYEGSTEVLGYATIKPDGHFEADVRMTMNEFSRNPLSFSFGMEP